MISWRSRNQQIYVLNFDYLLNVLEQLRNYLLKFHHIIEASWHIVPYIWAFKKLPKVKFHQTVEASWYTCKHSAICTWAFGKLPKVPSNNGRPLNLLYHRFTSLRWTLTQCLSKWKDSCGGRWDHKLQLPVWLGPAVDQQR